MGFPIRRRSRRASYRDAIDWITQNDDTEWLHDEGDDLIPSVTACLVADVFGRTAEEVTTDLRKAMKREAKE